VICPRKTDVPIICADVGTFPIRRPFASKARGKGILSLSKKNSKKKEQQNLIFKNHFIKQD
jgi:hypothetical protein